MGAPPARQGQREGAAEIDLEAIVIEADPQPMANQATGHAIEDVAQTKPDEVVTGTVVSS